MPDTITDTNYTLIETDQILPDPNNPRAGELEGIQQLADNIAYVGLLNPITVRLLPYPIKVADDNETASEVEGYMIVAGHRRFAACLLNGLKQIPALVVSAETGTELALTENVMRQNMHPVDEYRAFAKLKLEGASVKGIAKRFGLTDRQVKQRLALGSITSGWLDAWRAGKIDMHTAKILAQLKPAQQNNIWDKIHEKDTPEVINDWDVKRYLKDKKRLYPTETSVKFVGLEAYQAAGGRIGEDLFGDSSWLEDEELLAQLYTDKVKATVGTVLEEGWRQVYWYQDTGLPGYGTHKDVPAKKLENIEPDEKTAIDVVLTLDWKGDIDRRFWKDRPAEKPKPEGDRPAAYGKDLEKPIDIRLKEAILNKMFEGTRITGRTHKEIGEELIEKLQAITWETKSEGNVTAWKMPEMAKTKREKRAETKAEAAIAAGVEVVGFNSEQDFKDACEKFEAENPDSPLVRKKPGRPRKTKAVLEAAE